MKKVIVLLVIAALSAAFVTNSAQIMDAAYNNGFDRIGDFADLVTQLKTPAPQQ